MRHCEDCGLPMARCICAELPCYRCGLVGCDGECDELDLEPDVNELDFSHDEEDD